MKKTIIYLLFVLSIFHIEIIPQGCEYNSNIDVRHYDIKLSLFTKEKLIKGNTTISFSLLNKSDEFSLDLYDNMKINSVFLNNSKISFIHNENKLKIKLPNKFIARDSIINIQIEYEGTPKKVGLAGFVFGKINNQSLVYNLSEPNFSSTWFPCNDYAPDKALIDMYIENDSSEVSVSNGKLIDVENKGDRKVYHWKSFYPISTYLICLYSSHYENFNDKYISQDGKDTMDIEYYVLPGHLDNARIDFNGHPEMIKFFATTFGEYPFIKEKYGVAEFLWQQGAMEHQTITGIGSLFVSGYNFYRDIYVHELSHHWWGDAITPATWNDIWLNEGFATYSEALFQEYKAGNDALKSTMLSKFDPKMDGILYKPGSDLFSILEYNKGSWVLHMLRYEVGDSNFFKILRTYFNNYKYKYACTADFEKICTDISGMNLTKFFDQWVYKGNKSIEISFNYDQKTNNNEAFDTELDIKQNQIDYSFYTFHVDAELIYEDKTSEIKRFYIDEREKLFKFEVSKKIKNIVIDPNNWMFLTVNNKN